jgi:hypothetical protein
LSYLARCAILSHRRLRGFAFVVEVGRVAPVAWMMSEAAISMTKPVVMNCRSERTQLTRKYLVTIAVALILLLAWTLRLYRLDAQGLQYEEGYAVYIAGLAPTETLLWSSRDLLPPLHSYLLAGWLPLVGRSEFSVRFLSVAAGTLTVAVLARLGRSSPHVKPKSHQQTADGLVEIGRWAENGPNGRSVHTPLSPFWSLTCSVAFRDDAQSDEGNPEAIVRCSGRIK